MSCNCLVVRGRILPPSREQVAEMVVALKGTDTLREMKRRGWIDCDTKSPVELQRELERFFNVAPKNAEQTRTKSETGP